IDDGIQFVDLWSVRRRMTRRSPEGRWSSLVSDRRRAEGEAMFLQFQAQIAEVRNLGEAPQTVRAADVFELLPPLGILLVGPPGTATFDRAQFFTSSNTREPVYTEGAKVDALVRTSFAYPPFHPQGDELVWLYEVREAIEDGPSTQDYLIFANGQTPYVGDARFDLAYWDFANFALTA
ncbi:MAG: hypothetical protein ACHQDE_03320, partial [Acidimicrobiia bacterium]